MKKDIHHYSEKGARGQGLVIETGLAEPPPSWSKNCFLLAGGVFVLAVLLFASWINFIDRPAGGERDFQYFEIEPGESTGKIARHLADEGLIHSYLAFVIFAKTSASKPIQAGYYKLSGGFSTKEILEKFQKGETDAFSITIPEGFRVLQIAKLLQDKGGIDPNDFVEAAIGTEGTLFPDTYIIPRNLESAKIVRMMRENFEKRTVDLKATEEHLILASIIEREALGDEERPKIAAVFSNRAKYQMLFQADPTIRYALDSQRYLEEKSVNFVFWEPISRDDIKELNSPFNTYKQKGYPPAPICNPGLKSIEAAVNPEEGFDFYYFFHDKSRQVRFSKTYQEHLESIREHGVSSQE